MLRTVEGWGLFCELDLEAVTVTREVVDFLSSQRIGMYSKVHSIKFIHFQTYID